MHSSSLPKEISTANMMCRRTGLAPPKKRQNNDSEFPTVAAKAPFVPMSIEICEEDDVLVSTTLDTLEFGVQGSDVIVVKEECHELDFDEREALLGDNEHGDDSSISGKTFDCDQTNGAPSVGHKELGVSTLSINVDKNRKRREFSNNDEKNADLNEHRNSIELCQALRSGNDEDEVLKIFNTEPPMQSAASKRNRIPTQKTAEYLCRLCGQHSFKVVKIFGTQGKQMQISDKINLHLPIKVHEKDLLPLGVCLVCLAALKTSDDLYKNSLSTDNRLRQIFLKEDSIKKVDRNIICGVKTTCISCGKISNYKQYFCDSSLLSKKKPKIQLPLDEGPSTHPNEKTTKDSSSLSKKKPKIQLPLDEGPSTHPNEKTTKVENFIKVCENDQKHSSTVTKEITELKTISISKVSTAAMNNGGGGVHAEETNLDEGESSDEESDGSVDSSAEESSSDNEEEEEEEDEREDEDAADNEGQVKRKTHQTKTEQTCDLCEKVCLGVRELLEHRKTHSPEERLTCKVCGKRMPTDGSFRSHLKTHIVDLHPCDKCGKMLSNKSSLKNHMLLHADPKFSCDICGKTTFTAAKLRSHMVVHSDERPFCCSTCGQRFKTKHVHDQHVITHSEKHMHICEICGQGFHRPSHLSSHMLVHNKPQNGTSDPSNNHQVFKKWRCKVCFVQYSNHSSMLKHYETDHPETVPKEEVLCPTCGKRFLDEKTLKSHKRDCGRVFSCEYCGRVFAKYRALKIHIRDHTGERPFTCKFCPKSFKSAGLLQYHERIHTGERPYKCSVCDKAFRSGPHLSQHSLVHGAKNKYKCKMCNYETPRPGALKQHQRVHTGERPYRCDLCGKAYKHSTDLNNHVKWHSAPDEVRQQRKQVRKSARKTEPVVLDDGSSSNYSASIEQELNSL